MGAERREENRVRASHAAVRDVAADGHREPFDFAFRTPYREGVEQRLRGVLVHAITRVDDARVRARRDIMRRTRRGMAHDEDVRVHGLEVFHGVEQRLALGDARARPREVDDVGR